ncbi:NADH:ubiquinone oxidoreductase subunit J [Collibacillus ludicampi]|jgi:NADH-quinone oxidoreductase subunit J|uniref:NADH-quinone oxidoreductase subunit J n=1 Tax=Collibacillus ludicampi TaxID=2771369 RepID=A0AAV4LD60_9BACL|nr:NADH-quinone oxidoreductase subunit J [Collibacillus ludicampi]GIM45691.1 NADH:ubiquinone oxidoreductase subunit J [Collibacillus ludicampi]
MFNLPWSGQLITFFIISLLIIASAIAMLNLRKVIYMALAIGGVFIGVAGVYVLLDAEFVAFAQVLLYAGAITILMLFAIMLTHHDSSELEYQWNAHTVVSAIGAAGFLGVLMWAIRGIGATDWPQSAESAWKGSSVNQVAETIFNNYTIPFELVSIVLIVALVGAVILARREEE